MRYTSRSLGSLVATMLIAGLATVACGRAGSADQAVGNSPLNAQTQEAAQATQAPTAATPTEDSADSPDPSAAAGDAGSAADTGSTGDAGSAGSAATADPIDGELKQIDQYLNGVGGSISGADTSGGE